MFQELFITNADPNWRTGTIINLGTVIGGSTPSKAKPEYYTKNGIAWITPKDLSINKSKFITHGENDITELGLKNSSATVMPEGTVLPLLAILLLLLEISRQIRDLSRLFPMMKLALHMSITT